MKLLLTRRYSVLQAYQLSLMRLLKQLQLSAQMDNALQSIQIRLLQIWLRLVSL